MKILKNLKKKLKNGSRGSLARKTSYAIGNYVYVGNDCDQCIYEWSISE